VSDLLARLGLAVLLPQHALAQLIRTAPIRYKVYRIPKRAPGEFRTIAQPAREVKALQYWVMNNVLNQFAVHPAATAYRKQVSIVRNAKPHAQGRFLLKMDFKDFFPSLKAADFRSFLQAQGADLDEDEVSALCNILFWSPKEGPPELCLSIGAPTSPLLSNVLMMEFDRDTAALCNARRVRYTRYADDLSFSAANSEDLQLVEQGILGWCDTSTSPRLEVNQKKTVRVSKRESRRVTGLVLTNDRKVSLGRDTKRAIRAAMHHFSTGRLTADQIQRLRGMLAYVNSVEPTFLERLRGKYGSDVVTRCLQTKPDSTGGPMGGRSRR
jgi:RNA-directed DNA polymerase